MWAKFAIREFPTGGRDRGGRDRGTVLPSDIDVPLSEPSPCLELGRLTEQERIISGDIRKTETRRLDWEQKKLFYSWLFDTRTYLDISQGTFLTAKQRQRLVSVKVPWDHALTGEILRRGLIVYQESLVTQMIPNYLLSEVRKAP